MMRKLDPHSLNHVSSTIQQTKALTKQQNENISFDKIFQDKIKRPSLQYSRHANIKMQSMGLVKTKDLDGQLELATQKARQKNIQEGLILVDNYGFVVSIKNNTVITVINLNDKEESVFTNIDGAVII